ncbi:GNAT family N-acetyltransferase [Kitasatospora viridis]|uniref:N-acetylglutamate synthase-like GNAT family acetyltransferase n=1 Tax=Kitasatospora viridis TaxID=281105 RepID=A0A561TTS4_9ACTN|nr:GNAT family N-acetyltransferase [Kitasatospora viridis]TWF90503.1 N-acetylglutamate synthase-like GNAT family acetyltransferase [Kitasatospora viridis]
MHGLTFHRLSGGDRLIDGDPLIDDWQRIHNLIIPTDPLSLEQVRERAGRYHLEVVRLDGTAIGCSTVRPPTEEEPVAMVIARILPAHRRRGFGGELYRRGLERARAFGAPIETVVLASNPEGLAFAEAQGFTEVERYLLPGDTVPYVALRLTA